MSISFLANVGSRDVIVEGRANLPKDSRTLGEMILADWGQYRDDLHLPILVKALEAVIKKHSKVDHIVLFASDQRDKAYRHTDTLPFAQIVKQVLKERYGDWIETATEIITIADNPSDYDKMLHFYSEALQKLMQRFQSDIVYAAVSGGTPAMSFMLLWQGVEMFQQRIQPLYVIQERPLPLQLNIGQMLLMNAILSDIRRSIQVYGYSAAKQLLSAHEGLLDRLLPTYRAVCSIVEYSYQRLNFNFEAAEGALLGAESGLDARFVPRIDSLIDSIRNRDSRWLLREEIFGAEIDFRTHAYKDALANVFAFREGLLRWLALHEGVQLEDNRKLAPEWLKSQPELRAYLQEKNIDLNRNVTTFVFERILGFLAKQNPALKTLTDRIERFEKLSKIRNDAIHNHAGVSINDVSREYNGSVEDIIHDMRDLLEQITNTDIGDNPYDTINALILDLIEVRS